MAEFRCKRCNRILKSQKAIELGYGSFCYKKILDFKRYKKLFEYPDNENIDITNNNNDGGSNGKQSTN